MTNTGASLGTIAARTFIVGRLRGTLAETVDEQALAAQLLAGPTGGRVHTLPFPDPDEFPLPAIGISRYGSNAVDTAPLGRNQPAVTSNIRFQVRAIVEGFDDTPIQGAADIMNQLLDGQTGLVDLAGYGTFNVECTRESELLTDLPPEDDGTVYQHLGGIYAFFVSRIAD